MKLPYLPNGSKPLTVSGGFKGIGENQLSDAVNLNCSNICRTRNPRQAVFLYSDPPDQIIKCEDNLFLRYGNTLKQLIMDFDGVLKQTAQTFQLSNLSKSTDRRVLMWDGCFYAFPDKIRFGYDVWKSFAENNSLAVALPFTDAHTLFYTLDTASANFCDDSSVLKVGMKIRIYDNDTTILTVKTIETKTALSEDGLSLIEVGKRITLDKDFPKYNSLSAEAEVEYCDPANRPILNDLTVGFNHNVAFSGNKITITSVAASYSIPLDEFFKVGQTVDISGSSIYLNNIRAKITDIKDGALYFDKNFTAVEEATGTTITVTPVIPDFSHLLITEDRLFGIDNEDKRLHVSALNNPFLFYDNVKEPEDAWSMTISDPCTGITVWKDSVICFTENGGFRLLGYNAKNFGIRQLSLTGIKKECENSLCRVGDTLYYCSNKGVMRYSGGSDNNIFLPSMKIRDVKKASTDGVFVYMLTDDKIWVYDTVTSLYWSEDNKSVRDVFNFKGKTYLALNQALHLVNGEGNVSVNWSFTLPLLPNDEYQRIMPLDLSVVHLADTDCLINLHYKAFGEAVWKNCGAYQLKGEGKLKIPLPKSYCNGFEIKAEGNGMFCPESWLVNYRRLK